MREDNLDAILNKSTGICKTTGTQFDTSQIR